MQGEWKEGAVVTCNKRGTVCKVDLWNEGVSHLALSWTLAHFLLLSSVRLRFGLERRKKGQTLYRVAPVLIMGLELTTCRTMVVEFCAGYARKRGVDKGGGAGDMIMCGREGLI